MCGGGFHRTVLLIFFSIMAKADVKPTVGRIVIYFPVEGIGPERQNGADYVPAVVVRTWEDIGYKNDEVNLNVFTDGAGTTWRTSVPYSRTGKPGTWCWWQDLDRINEPVNMAAAAPVQIALGMPVRDVVTGFCGTTTAKIEYMDRDAQWRVEATWQPGQPPAEPQWIDASRLEVNNNKAGSGA